MSSGYVDVLGLSFHFFKWKNDDEFSVTFREEQRTHFAKLNGFVPLAALRLELISDPLRAEIAKCFVFLWEKR